MSLSNIVQYLICSGAGSLRFREICFNACWKVPLQLPATHVFWIQTRSTFCAVGFALRQILNGVNCAQTFLSWTVESKLFGFDLCTIWTYWRLPAALQVKIRIGQVDCTTATEYDAQCALVWSLNTATQAEVDAIGEGRYSTEGRSRNTHGPTVDLHSWLRVLPLHVSLWTIPPQKLVSTRIKPINGLYFRGF